MRRLSLLVLPSLLLAACSSGQSVVNTVPRMPAADTQGSASSVSSMEVAKAVANSSASSVAAQDSGSLPSFTLAQVAQHASETDCYSAINGGVYNLTGFGDLHKGGKEAVLAICGKDGSDAFNAKHGGKEKQASVLATMKIGILK